jgi:hypothetical protein
MHHSSTPLIPPLFLLSLLFLLLLLLLLLGPHVSCWHLLPQHICLTPLLLLLLPLLLLLLLLLLLCPCQYHQQVCVSRQLHDLLLRQVTLLMPPLVQVGSVQCCC